MKTKALQRPKVRTVLLAGLAVILTWLIVSRSLAAYLAEVAPEAALWLRPGEPEALVNLAAGALNLPVAESIPEEQKNTPDSTTASGSAAFSQNLSYAFDLTDQNRSIDLSSVRARAEAALMNEPLNARALRILGQVADLAKDNAGAWKFMQIAARLSLHEYIADYWLMRKSSKAGDYKAVTYYADVLLRAAPQFVRDVVPILALTGEDGTSNGLLKSLLASNPPWRRRFFAILPSAVTDARMPLDLLNSLRTSSAPPTSAEIDPYLELLVTRKRYDLAYYSWLQFLPPKELRSAGSLFNGSFEFAPSGLPFDWVISSGSGVTIDVVQRPDRPDENALLVDFQYGRVDYHSVTQLIMLTPGTYEFKGKYQGELVGPRGLKWRIVCADNPTIVGESSMMTGVTGMTPSWKDVDFLFTVPSTDCRAQYVRLDLDARMASEQLISGSMMFDELQIARSVNSRSGNTQAE